MSRALVALSVLVLAVTASAAVGAAASADGVSASAGSATPIVDAPGSTDAAGDADTADAAGEVDDAASAGSTTTRDENLSVEVQTPRTVATNVSLNYSVDVDGASGDVTATWTFENETKSGQRVAHSFATEGNETIEVTVRDESGASVTESVTVEVVDYTDEAESRPGMLVGNAVLIFVGMFGVPLLLLIFVVPKAMEILTDEL